MVLVQVQPSAIFICCPSVSGAREGSELVTNCHQMPPYRNVERVRGSSPTEGSIPKGGHCTAVAQLVEQRSPKPPVDSSILFCRAKHTLSKKGRGFIFA